MSAVVEVQTVANTTLGRLNGTREGGVGVWRGVPYARQPLGELRFAAPVAPEPWTGVRDALEHGPIPPQGKSFVGGGRDDPKNRDEACLTLTVWSPDTTAALPVMVWLPGGAFVYGAGQLQLYNGSRLAANGRVVVVNVTYRIGVFGGLDLSALGEGFADNLALRDQIAALRWVRENIAAFGGDPGRVTVFGESAGATSVLALLASPAADGLFARAIAQSPALPLIADRDTRADRATRFLELLNLHPEQVKSAPQRSLRRAAGLLQLESVAETPTLAYGLTHGVDLLPSHPIEAARAGAVRPVPLIIGTNSHEASMFAWGKPPMLPTTLAGVDSWFDRCAPEARDRILSAYPGYPRRQALVAIGSDVMFGAPAWAFTDAYSAQASTYAYRFDHTAVALRALGLGATHGSEIVHIHHSYASYLGRKLHPLGRHLPPSVGRRMQRTWLDFATRGWAPGEKWRDDWPRYDADRRRTRVIRSMRDESVDDPDAVRRSAWTGVY
ncbi:carboxylesterase [Mycobacterium sp. IS-1496]|uniref:carboxylesterase/lipase family protein n=1 Tax=Mycobacterium sp. IS-1496 TaxID=1772284 RepID=UPI0007417E42|nr:carboxylesterase/lipase family protein [Mycobacterium sp. IS-1496]KUI36171.1 carboxylesterase [Mycobacterium sp. IS-1496]